MGNLHCFIICGPLISTLSLFSKTYLGSTFMAASEPNFMNEPKQMNKIGGRKSKRRNGNFSEGAWQKPYVLWPRDGAKALHIRNGQAMAHLCICPAGYHQQGWKKYTIPILVWKYKYSKSNFTPLHVKGVRSDYRQVRVRKYLFQILLKYSKYKFFVFFCICCSKMWC